MTKRTGLMGEAVKTAMLLVAVNMEWAFILTNFQQIQDIRAIAAEKPSKTAQEAYLNAIGAGERGRGSESAFPSAIGFVPERFVPRTIALPSIGKSAPLVSASGSSAEPLLDSGAVLYDFWAGREGEYVLGHSSSFNEGPYRYLFTKLPKVGRGDVAVLEGDSVSRVYSYVGRRILAPEDLPSLPDGKWKLYVITCYPFLTTLKRYVAEFRFEREVPKGVSDNAGPKAATK